jgi:hypothetical protein
MRTINGGDTEPDGVRAAVFSEFANQALGPVTGRNAHEASFSRGYHKGGRPTHRSEGVTSKPAS